MSTVYSINDVNFQPLEAMCYVWMSMCVGGRGGGGPGRFAVGHVDG